MFKALSSVAQVVNESSVFTDIVLWYTQEPILKAIKFVGNGEKLVQRVTILLKVILLLTIAFCALVVYLIPVFQQDSL